MLSDVFADTSPSNVTSGNIGMMGGNNATNSALMKISRQYQENNELVGRMPPVGIDAVIQDWVRQAFIYRRSILQDMFLIAYQTTEIRAALLAIKRSVFKRGLGEWTPKFKRKCTICEKEYDDISQEECEDCYLYSIKEKWYYDNNNIPYKVNEPEFVIDEETNDVVHAPTREPDDSQKKIFENFAKSANIFNKTLFDTMKEFFEDILIADDGFLLLNKEYEIDMDTGEIINQEIYEVTRLHPALVEFDIDRKDGLPERSHWLCPLHRNQQVFTGPGRCNVTLEEYGRICNTILLPSMYRYYIRGRYRYYTRDEIIHKSYFSPSKTYGYSPVLTVLEKVLSLLGIDRWYYRYFYERKIPPGLIITYTDDPDSLRTEIDRIQTEMLDDPNKFPWIAASARTQRGRTDNVKLGYTFEEMDSISIRNEIRERVGNLWGVTPMHQGDPSGAGSFTRESAQTTMFDETIEAYQKIIDEGVLDIILEQLGITDWDLKLAKVDEKTEQEIIELGKLNIDNATGMQNLGYKAKLKKDSKYIDFDYEEMGAGMLGGMMGMGMPQPGGEMGMGMEGDNMQGAAGLPPPPDLGGEGNEEEQGNMPLMG